MQKLAPAIEYEPVGQTLHVEESVALAAEEKFPAEHNVQADIYVAANEDP